MNFVIIGRDHEDAFERRMAVRDEHLARLVPYKENGAVIFVVALKDENDGHINGSIIVFNVESRQEVDEIMKDEPYIANNVWKSIEVIKGIVPPIHQA